MDPVLRELLDADSAMERVERLHIQAGWSFRQIKAHFVSEGFIEADELLPSNV
jgi:hypothetical protein